MQVFGPIMVRPYLAQLITEVATKFAKEYGLELESWYHDQPIWILWKRFDWLVRRVQVAVYDTSEGRQIRFIPDACVLREQRFVSTIPQAPHVFL